MYFGIRTNLNHKLETTLFYLGDEKGAFLKWTINRIIGGGDLIL